MNDMPFPADVPPALQALFTRDSAPHAMGIRLVSVGEGSAVLSLTVGAEHSNLIGLCHGGVIFTLADTAMGLAAFTNNPDTAVTQSADIHYITPAHPGEVLTATARLISRKGRTGIYDVTVTGPQDRVVALMRAQARFLAPRV